MKWRCLPPNPVVTIGANGAGAKTGGAPLKLGVGVDGVVGAGDTVVGRVAACSAIFCASLSPPANMIPDNVPVKNVAIGIINSKNF